MKPLLSVIVPTRGRPQQLRGCLTSLLEQTYARDLWELIVVVDGKNDAGLEEVRDWTGRLPLEYVEQEHGGCGMARNTGAGRAKGKYLIFTDDDCRFPPDWLAKYPPEFERTRDCLVAGRSTNFLTGNPYSQATQDLMDFLLSRFNANPEQALLAIGNNFGVPAKGFAELGGFSPRYFRAAAEDRDFCARWLARGRRIVYAPEVAVHHAHELTLASFLRQHMHYGRGAWLLHGSDSARREKPGFYLSMFREPGNVRAFALLVASQVAHTAGYAEGWLRELAGRE